MFTEDLKNKKDRVEYLLKKYPETRDSDKKLWLAYMCIFMDLKSNIATGSYEIFKKCFMSKETPSFETLRRNRQKFQEMNEDLRGDNYHDRQYEQVEVAKYLKEF